MRHLKPRCTVRAKGNPQTASECRSSARSALRKLKRKEEDDFSVRILSSRPFFRKKPFGKNIDGLSYKRDMVYAIDMAVQANDFEESPPGIVIDCMPLDAKSLQTFKRLGRRLRRFIV
jgi:hypothetical protein